jgi:LysR family transcriptional regulator, regulator for bpeEF and oprC
MLLAFLRAAEQGSFAAAARHLDVSAAAVGQAVQRLERHYGVRLLNRTTRRMSLTGDGRVLAERCRGLLAELEEIGRAFDERRRVVSGPLRVTSPAGFGRRHVVPLLARFKARHPAVQLELDLSDAVRDFAASPIDVAFRILRPIDGSVVARPLSRLQAVTVASPDYLERRGAPRSPSDLSRHDCLAYRHPATGNRVPMVFRMGGRDVPVPTPASMVLNDVDAGCEAAALGLGIAQPPSDYVAPYIAAGRLVPVLARFRATPWTLYLCYPGARQLPFRVRAFIDFARAELGRDRFSLP